MSDYKLDVDSPYPIPEKKEEKESWDVHGGSMESGRDGFE